MNFEQTFAGLETKLRAPRGRRSSGAIFLTVWLGFWAVGEVLVLGILLRGAWALVTGQPPGAGQETLPAAPSLAAGLFLFCWLAFWTLGGVLAGREWLRLLLGSDRLVLRPDGLEVVRSYGLFRTRTFFSRDRIRRFYRSGSGNHLMVEKIGGAAEVTQFGTPEERASLESRFNEEFKLSSKPAVEGILPEGWLETTSREGVPILVKDPVVRRKQARIVWILFVPFAVVALYLLTAVTRDPDLVAPLIITTVLAILIAWGALTLTRARDEWVLGRGSLALQRRSGAKVTPRFETKALQLVETTDSDSDVVYELVAASTDAPAAHLLPGARKHRQVVDRTSADATAPRNLGLWLARRCQIPFADHSTAEVKTQDLEELKRQLAASGRFGAWAVRALGRMKSSPTTPDEFRKS